VSLAVITVSNPSPALDKRFQEVAFIARALTLAETAIRSAGGAATSGNITDAGGVVVASYVYTPVASS
jgi:hypothetical protein